MRTAKLHSPKLWRNRQDMWMGCFGRGVLPGIGLVGSPPPAGRRRRELVGVEQVAQGDRLVAARARAARPEPTAPGVAGVASLLAEVAGVAERAGVDGVGAGHGRLGRGGPLRPPGSLPAPGRAEALTAEALERCPAHRADRRGAVAHGIHAAAPSPTAGSAAAVSSGRSTSSPSQKVAPARTKATRWGALTARQRSWAASISL